MVEILTQIISDLTRLSYYNILELVVNIITLIVLCFTLYFAIRYTKTSEKQTKELIEQRELSLLPSILFEFVINKQGTKPPQILLTNVGNSPAVNIKIRPIKLRSLIMPGGGQISFPTVGHILPSMQYCFEKLEGIGFKVPADTIKTALKLRDSDIITLPDTEISEQTNILLTDKNFNSFKVEMIFQDIKGNSYYQTHKYIGGQYFHGIVNRNF